MKTSTVFILVAVGWAALTYITSLPSEPKVKPPPDPLPAAREVCKTFAAKRLDDPGRTDWGASWDWTTIDNHDGTYGVQMNFNSPDKRGAMRRQSWTCIVRDRGGDQWALEDLFRVLP